MIKNSFLVEEYRECIGERGEPTMEWFPLICILDDQLDILYQELVKVWEASEEEVVEDRLSAMYVLFEDRLELLAGYSIKSFGKANVVKDDIILSPIDAIQMSNENEELFLVKRVPLFIPD